MKIYEGAKFWGFFVPLVIGFFVGIGDSGLFFEAPQQKISGMTSLMDGWWPLADGCLDLFGESCVAVRACHFAQ